MSTLNSSWKLSQSITPENNLFCCPSSVAISHRYNKLFVATYDDIECWMNNCCIQVYKIENSDDGEGNKYVYEGRMIVASNPQNLLVVSHDDDDSLIVTCSARYEIVRFEISHLLDNAFDDDDYSSEKVWTISGEFGFPSGLNVATDENGEKIIFACDNGNNRIAIISFKDGTILRWLNGKPKKDVNETESEIVEGETEEVETAEVATEETNQENVEETKEKSEIPTQNCAFKSVAHVSVIQNGNQYTLIVSGYNSTYKLVLNGLMSTDVTETELPSCGNTAVIDLSKNEILGTDCTSGAFSIVDLESSELKSTTQEFNLGRPAHMLLDNKTLYIVNDRPPCISILTQDK